MKQDFLKTWTEFPEKAEVALISPPITFPPVPSVALSIFQSALAEEQITSKVIYTMFPLIYMLGSEWMYELGNYMEVPDMGEYLFAHLTDVPCVLDLNELLRVYVGRRSLETQRHVEEMMRQGMEAAEKIVDAAARRVIHMGAKVAAVSSIFSQQNGALAILKKIKELDSSVYTLMGGFNVSGEMGMAILHHYPSVDYVSFGEGDETIARVCSILLGRQKAPMPYGVLAYGAAAPAEGIPYRMTKDMNQVPTPEYDDFFEEIRREEAGFYGSPQKYYAETYENTVFLEGSRGCWWGEKHACTFCGLNGLNHVYREKDPEKLHEEIRSMTKRYPGVMIQLSDNVLSQNMIRKLLPALAEDQEKYQILAEVKTNLRSEEVQMLSKAGIHITQPGIESLNDHLLNLMGKGSSAAQNIALLKYCRSFQIYPVWNMMFGIPGEAPEDYEQVLKIIPLIMHLQPPTRANPIILTRFSHYADNPEKYGLEIAPSLAYRFFFGDREELVQNMGTRYDLTGGPFFQTAQDNNKIYLQIYDAVQEWKKVYSSEQPPFLRASENLIGYYIRDTRPCARQNSYLLIGLNAAVYKLLWEPVSFDKLKASLPDADEEKIKKVLDELMENKLAVSVSGKYLGLATR